MTLTFPIAQLSAGCNRCRPIRSQGVGGSFTGLLVGGGTRTPDLDKVWRGSQLCKQV
jgi:hypothetical protein